MVRVIEMLSSKDTENKQFILSLVKYGIMTVTGILVLYSSMLGIKTKRISLPFVE